MSVNRFLYATNFVVNGSAQNRPSGPLVNVTGYDNKDIFKITLSGATNPDSFLLNGDLTVSGAKSTFTGSTFDAFYNTLTLSGPTMNLRGENLYANYLTSLTLSGPAMNLRGDVLDANYLTSLTLSGPAMNLRGQTLDANYSNSLTLSGPAMNLRGDVLDANYLTSLTLSGPAMNLRGDVLDANYLTSLTLSGPAMNLRGQTLDANYSNSLTLSGPALNLRGDVLDANYLTSLTLSGPAMNLRGENFDANYSNSLTLSGPALNLRGDVLDANYLTSLTLSGPALNLRGQTLDANYLTSLTLSGPAINLKGQTLDADYTGQILLKNQGTTIVTVDNKGMVVDGMLVVKGDMVTQSSQEVLLGDSHIVLNAQHKSGAVTGGGMAVVHKAESSIQTKSLTVSGSVRIFAIDPTLIGQTGITLKKGDIIQISEASRDNNNGYYILDSVNGPIVTSSSVNGPYTISASNSLGSSVNLDFVFQDNSNELFLKQANLVADQNMVLSHVNMSDIRITSDGEVLKAYGNNIVDPNFLYYPLGGSGGSYENVKFALGLPNTTYTGDNNSMNYKITKAVTVCEDTVNKTVNLELPDIDLKQKGAEYKIINKQQSTMRIRAADNITLINGAKLTAETEKEYVDVYYSSDDRSIVFIATISNDSQVRGWQML
jgi:hypothetical protein